VLDRATSLLVPPGSAFKIVTLTAALDTRRFSLTQVFTGSDAFGPSPYFDNSLYPSNITRADVTQVTLMQALAFSDNFTFAHIGLTLGAPTLLNYARRYYIGRQIPFDYPVSVSRIADAQQHPSLSVLAQSAFGAGVDLVTPLQMALIASTVANGGVMMAPHLVQDLETPKGKVLFRYPVHPLGRVMSAEAASNVTTAMSFVVNHGSGYKAQLSGAQAAGKTGTAVSGADKPNAWFISFAPAQHPVIAVAVLHEFSGEGFEYAAPVARKVLIAGLSEAGYRVKAGKMSPY
jgi:peptidoglycan glycosyltransferase